MNEQSNVISMTRYKKKRRTNHLIGTAYSATKFFSIGILVLLLIWTVYYLDHNSLAEEEHIEAKMELMEYTD